MSEWKKVRFLDVVHLNPRIFLEKGVEYPFVEMSNVVPCARKPEKDVFKKYLGGGTKFEQGDTIVARIEPCLQNGKGFQCTYKQGFGSTEFLVFRPVNINDLDCDFLYYYMGQQSIREAMAKTMVGASGRQRVNNKVFNDLQINLPPLSTQHRIASILSRYDSLIENYQKQIKLLEEAAQRLYKEWFIDLHFPGHENTNIIDGVPEGWEKKKVGDITPIITGKKDANFGTPDGEYPFFTCSQEPIKAPSFSFDCAAVLLAGNGDFNVKLYRGRFEAYQRTYVLSPYIDSHLYLLFYTISANMTKLAAGSSGSTIKFLTKGMIDGINLNVPNDEILRSFNKKVEPIQSSRESLQSQLRLLTEARDRLLPKLMSGEITI